MMPLYINPTVVNISFSALSDILQFIINANYDISGCVTNCSNNGLCKLQTKIQQYSCECNGGFSGKSCQIDSNPCSQSPCLNNGVCTSNSTTFSCACKTSYSGNNCEIEENICANHTCGGNGYCFRNGTQPACRCFSGYSGNECELASNALLLIKAVQTSSLAICLGSIVFTVVTILLNDVWNYFIPKHNKDKKSKRKRKHPQLHYKYISK